MNRKTIASRISILAAGAIGLAVGGIAPAVAQQQQAMPKGWFKTCTKQADFDICSVQNVMLAQTGQPLVVVVLIDQKGKVNRKALQVIVPTGRMVQPGVGLQVDGGQTRKLEYVICLPDRCIAEAPLTDELVSSFKRGSELTLTAVNAQQQPIPLKMTLQGFTGAYDGEPMQQSDLEERQRKIEEYVSQNTDEFAEKLKAAQEKAKQSN